MEALAIAKACSLNFIRAEGFVFSHVADEGFVDGSAGLLLRYRKNIGAEDVLIFTDIKKKHWCVITIKYNIELCFGIFKFSLHILFKKYRTSLIYQYR